MSVQPVVIILYNSLSITLQFSDLEIYFLKVPVPPNFCFHWFVNPEISLFYLFDYVLNNQCVILLLYLFNWSIHITYITLFFFLLVVSRKW
jgi:hypothetical protein